jgi:predicted nucleic acid-binding protein
MTPVFADTGFYVAFHNRRDALHGQAVELAARLTAPIITTEFVLLEVANFFKRPGDRGMFTAFDAALRLDSTTTIIPASSELYLYGRNLFSARADKEWSLVDCMSFHVMTERGLTDALTADEHFEQAGFRILLRLGT